MARVSNRQKLCRVLKKSEVSAKHPREQALDAAKREKEAAVSAARAASEAASAAAAEALDLDPEYMVGLALYALFCSQNTS